jgi:hypothetical protein
VKISEPIEIKNNFLLSIGENFIVITFGLENDMLLSEKNNTENDEIYKNFINLNIFSENIKHGNINFSPNQSPISIGRSPECDIIINDNMLSRFHCFIEYKNGRWYITDGYIEENSIKKSTNGTWIYAFDDILVKNGMTFKANKNIFICTLE